MATTLTWTRTGISSVTPLVFTTGDAALLRLLRLKGIETPEAQVYSSKGPGQEGSTALDVVVPERVVQAQALIQTASQSALWDERRVVSKNMGVIPVRFGESLAVGTLLLQRTGKPDLLIDAVARSFSVDPLRAPGMAAVDCEWLCPYPYWRDTVDSSLEVGPLQSVGRVVLTSGTSSTDATSYVTASVTLKPGRLYLLAVQNSKATTPDTPAPSGGVTWTSVATTAYGTIAAPTNRLTVFRGMRTLSTDYNGPVTIDFAGATQTGACWALIEYEGVDTTTTQGVRQSASNATDSGTAVTATLAAFGNTKNATVGFTAKASVAGVTPGTGFTEDVDVNAATPAQSLAAEFQAANDTSVDQSWTGAAAAAVIGLEIVAIANTAANGGDVDAPILARLWGPATSVKLTNLTSGEAFSVTVTLTSAEYLEVDTTPGVKSITKVSGATRTNAMSGLSLTDASLFLIRPDNNSLKFENGGFAQVYWRNRYAGA